VSDWITPAAAVATALATSGLAAITWSQLGELRKQLQAQAEQLKIQGEREKQWRTIEACERYTYDPVLRDAKLAIWRARENGRAEHVADPPAVRRDVVVLLNYLDAVGVGVEQGVYIEDIVQDHLKILVVETVNRFIKGQWGRFEIDEAKMNGLMYLYHRFARSEVTHKAAP
jgi:hypothetical protein